jgi:hypothetical protein
MVREHSKCEYRINRDNVRIGDDFVKINIPGQASSLSNTKSGNKNI